LLFDFGAVRLVTGVAGQAPGVIGRGHLRESFWFGAIGFVAASTNDSGIELWGLYRGRIIRVFGLRAVTGLAWNDGMFPKFLLIDDFSVAGLAHLVSRMGNGAGREFSDGVSAVMTVLAERARNYRGAQHDERDQREDHHSSEPDEVFGVFEQSLTLAPDRGRYIMRGKSAMIFDTGNPSKER
jgi:hypothetical protein